MTPLVKTDVNSCETLRHLAAQQKIQRICRLSTQSLAWRGAAAATAEYWTPQKMTPIVNGLGRGRRSRHAGRPLRPIRIFPAMTASRIVCFGELLLRLGAPGHERLLQSPRL